MPPIQVYRIRRSVEVHVVAQPHDQVGQLRDALLGPDFVGHLVRRGHDGAGIVGKRRHRHQDEVIAVLQPPDDLGRSLAALVLAEELFDVLDLERALLERISS